MSTCTSNQYLDYLMSFDSLIREYIPKQLLKEYEKMESFDLVDSGEKRIQMIMENSKNLLRMYGTPGELQNNLRIYWSFPFNHFRFQAKITHTIPVKYRNLKGELFYCKQELFVHFFAATCTSFQDRVLPKELSDCMITHIQYLKHSYEFVKYNKEVFVELRKTFHHSANLHENPLENETEDTAWESDTEVKDAKYYLKAIENLIGIYPEIFLPNTDKKKMKNPIFVVRIFEDDDKKFVMDSEFFSAINHLNPDMKPLESKSTSSFFRTIKLIEVFTTYRDLIKSIEFIRSPIIRTKHAAVPIVTPTGGHCILISDFIIEIFRRMIFGLNLFQKLDEKTWHLVVKFVDMNLNFIPSSSWDCIIFINLQLVDGFRKKLNEYWKDVDVVNKVIRLHPSLFLPYSEYNSPDTPIVVRIFEDNGQKFVMKSELFNDSRIKNSNEEIQKLEDKNGILWAIDYDEVVEKFKEQIDKIEFISVPIQRAKHAAVPIVTPSGDHCILGSDVVLELLRRLISALRVFQNFNKDRWQMVTHYMEFLSSKIDLDSTNKFFISTVFFDKLKYETDGYWLKRSRGNSKKNHKISIAKVVRDVGKLGFSLDFLKEELKLLKVTNAFPDVFDHVELAYSLVFKQKKYQFLKTCDLVDAVEQCQLYSILKKFPSLRKFLQKQKTFSDLLDQSENLPLHNVEKLVENSDDCEFVDTARTILKDPRLDAYSENDMTLDGPNQTTIASNYKFLTDDQLKNRPFDYFIFEIDDLRCIDESKWEECLMNYESFMKSHPNKKVYIRWISTEKVFRVFAEDILKIAGALLKQQNREIEIESLLSKYRETWKTGNPNTYRLITRDEMKSALSDLKIDMNRVTFVPDLLFAKSFSNWMKSAHNSNVWTSTPDGRCAIDRTHAIFHIFQSVVCGINWKLDCCNDHPNCKETFKMEVINAMIEYCKVKPGTLIIFDSLEEKIQKLREHCYYQLQKTLKLPESESDFPNKTLPPSFYNSVFDAYGLENRYRILSDSADESPHVSVWLYRVSYIFEWAKVVFDKNDHLHLRTFIQNMAVARVPVELLVKGKTTVEKILDCYIRIEADNKSKKETDAGKIAENSNETEENDKIKIMESDAIGKTDDDSEKVRSDGMRGDSEDSDEISEGEKKNLESDLLMNKDIDSERFEESGEDGTIEETVDNESTSQINEISKTEKKDSEFDPSKDFEKEEIVEEKIVIESTSEITESAVLNESAGCLECVESALEKVSSFLKTLSEDLKSEIEKGLMMEKKLELLEKEKNEEIERMRLELEEKNALCQEMKDKLLVLSDTRTRVEDMDIAFKKNNVRIEKLEKKMQEIDKEKEQMELNHSKALKSKDKKIEMLKKNAAISKEEKKLLKQKNNETERNLKQQIVNFQEKCDQQQAELDQLKVEISEKNRESETLKKENLELISDKEASRKDLDDMMSRISIHHEEQGKIIQQFLGRSPNVSSESSTSEKSPNPFEIQMTRLQKINDSMESSNPLKLAKEMVEKLISLSSRTEIPQHANYELQLYEGKIRNYGQVLELNIHNLMMTDDISCIIPLPDFPSFSDKFMTEYWAEIDKKPSLELSDSECYICFSEMKSDEKTLECEHCKKITHLECASKWLQIHRSCGHCRQKQLDPNEFPALG